MPKRIATTPAKITGFKPKAGRPKSNVGNYVLRPSTVVDSGFQMLNSEPETIKAAREHYMKLGQLPPGLAPRRLRSDLDVSTVGMPDVLKKAKNRNISKGQVKPKSQQV